MLGLGKYVQIRFYIEYSINTHGLVLWMKGCKSFGNWMCDATHNESFGSVSTASNEAPKIIYYTIDDIFFFF